MAYSIKEIYYTIQGEGQNIGRPAIFCRFNICNLWSGREQNREKAICKFCDTDFIGTDGAHGGEYIDANELSETIKTLWLGNGTPFVVFTGGEPLLQLDKELIDSIKKLDFEVAVESNGTIKAPHGIDWLTISPKYGSKLVQTSGSEIKIVYPQDIDLEEMGTLDFQFFLLSPLITDKEDENRKNLKLVSDYVLAHPKWRMTYQSHKIWGLK